METRTSIYELGITPGLGYITGPEGQRAERDALTMDKSPARRVVVSLVGKERQGKTSLRRLLAGQPFDPNEPSTVGIEKELVDTQALDTGSTPGRVWTPTNLKTANQQEFSELLGHHIWIRLENHRTSMPVPRRVIYSIHTLANIGIIAFVTLVVFFAAASVSRLNQWPIFGAVIIGMFLVCGMRFGIRDGYGIAVGIFHLIIMCECLQRWTADDLYRDSVDKYGTLLVFVIGICGCVLMEAIVATCYGMSLGLGIVCVFCLSRPPNMNYFQGGIPFLQPQIPFFAVGCLFGLGSARYSTGVVVSAMVAALSLLPETLSFLFVCGTMTGCFHGLFLAIGRSVFFPRLIYVIKRLCSSTLGRHLLRHLTGMIPGVIIAKFIFGWTLVLSPTELCIRHAITALLLITVNELPILLFNHLISSSSSYFSSSSSSSSLLHPTSPNEVSSINGKSAHASTPFQCQPSRVIDTTATTCTPRIVVRDFAGHPLYYSAHHVYMAGQCIYVLVFSLVDAHKDFQAVLKTLITWLQSIYLHTGFPETRVFIVGTHRDDPELRALNMDVVASIGRKLRKKVPRHFHNILVWTDKDIPLFPVENSIRDRHDPDHKYLRDRIMKTVNELNVNQHPIRYFYFFHVLEKRRADNIFVEETDVLFSECKENQCAIKDRDDFQAMLLLFQRLGEVLYFPEDNLLASVVVLSPHAVLGLVSRLLDIPKMDSREREFVFDWDRLQVTGVCTRKLFNHVLEVHTHPAKVVETQRDTLLYLLQTLNLICPLGSEKTPVDGEPLLGIKEQGGGEERDTHYQGQEKQLGGIENDEDDIEDNGGENNKTFDSREPCEHDDDVKEASCADCGGSGDSDDDDKERDRRNAGRQFDTGGSNYKKRESDKKDIKESEEKGKPSDELLYLVPAALPEDLLYSHHYWQTSSNDWQLLIDGIPVLPQAAYLRLVCVCATQDVFEFDDDQGFPVLTACQSRSAFTFKQSQCYKLEWVTGPGVTSIYHGRLLKLVIAEKDHTNRSKNVNCSTDVILESPESRDSKLNPKALVDFIWRSLLDIIRRDFNRCHLRIGVQCPCHLPHQNVHVEDEFHFLSLSDTRESNVDQAVVPSEKEFWCCGRKVLYSRGKVHEITPSCDESFPIRNRSSSLTALDLPLCNMPHTLYSSVCDLLDIPHALGNDWTALAGHLGKTVREVELLRYRAPRDPCDALLQDWMSRAPKATIFDLISIMYKINRMDVVKTIQDFSFT